MRSIAGPNAPPTSGFATARPTTPVFLGVTATAIEACEAAWEFYGGVFRAHALGATKCGCRLSSLPRHRVDELRDEANERNSSNARSVVSLPVRSR